MKIYIDPDQVRRDFCYCPETGELKFIGVRLKDKGHRKCIHIGHGGKQYYRSRLNEREVYNHRIIWTWMTGEQPETIDHIDGNGLNNRWENLRNVPFKENSKNQKLHSTNTSGFMGVTYRKDSGKWRARIVVDSKKISLGSFESREDAIEARMAAMQQYGFHAMHGAERTAIN